MRPTQYFALAALGALHTRPEASDTYADDIVALNAGDGIERDGIVVDGCALVDEAAFTGVSEAALIDASEGRNRVLAGTQVKSGTLKIRYRC